MKDSKALVDLLMTAAFVALMLFVVKAREPATANAEDPMDAPKTQEVSE